MTPVQVRMLDALTKVSMLSGIPAKRFIHDMVHKPVAHDLTPNQDAYLRALVWRYRRQIADKVLTAAAGITSLREHGSRGHIAEHK